MKYKGTLVDFNLIKKTVETYSKETNITESTSFLSVVQSKWLELDDSEIESSIIDGADDFGIDAIHIDDSNGPSKIKVYFFQSKYYKIENKFNRAFEGNALDKMVSAINTLIRNEKTPESVSGNVRLMDKIRDVKTITKKMPEYHVVFCSNSFPPSEKYQKKFQVFMDDINNVPNTIFVHYLHLHEVANVLAPQKKVVINEDLKLSGKIITWDSGEAKTIVGRLKAVDLAKLRDEHGDSLFEQNVRGYLSRKNPINKDIFDSASSEKSSEFFYLNNGITIICRKMKYSIESESPVVRLTDMQIVNGGQTTNAIYDAFRQDLLKHHAYLLVKIIETDSNELLEKITKATNKQTEVTARDLRSNDPIQKRVEEYFKLYGYFYEARKDKYTGEKRSMRVDAAKAAQAYYAFNNQKPADARNKKRFLFGSFYEEVFNDELDMERYLLAFRLYQIVNKLSRSLRDKYSFIYYAELHTLAMLKDFDINRLTDLNNISNIERVVKNILKHIGKIVDEEIKKKGDDYSHRAFFIDPNLLGRIKETMLH